MIKKVIYLLLLYTVVFAANMLNNNFMEKYPLVKNVFKANNLNYEQYKPLLKKDKYFQLGNEYLFNKDLRVNPIKKRKKSFKGLPDYKKAIKQFELSVKNYKNPISAYEGLYLIQTYYFQKNYKNLRENFLKIVIKNGFCQGYITYANILLKENTKASLLKAKKLLSGKNKCFNNNTYKNIIKTKLATIKWRLRLLRKHK